MLKKIYFLVFIFLSSWVNSPVSAWVYNFNNGESGWTASGGWKYSGIDGFPNATNVPFFTSVGDYFWSQSVDSNFTLISPKLTGIYDSTSIYFRHWFYTNNASFGTGIIVYIIHSLPSFSFPLQTLTTTNTNWSSLGVVNCKQDICCQFYPCSFQLGISSSVGVVGEGIAAIQCVSDDQNACANDSTYTTTSSIETSTFSTSSSTAILSTTIPPISTTTEAPPPTSIDIASIVLLSITCALTIAIFIIMLYYMCCKKSKVITRVDD